MHAAAKIFLGIATASAALLAGPSRVHFHELSTSFCSFVLEDVQKAAPRGITDCQAESAALDHPLDVQVLHRNQAVGKDKSSSNRPMMFATQIGNANVYSLNSGFGLPAIHAAWFLSGKRPLSLSQFRQGNFEIARVRFVPAIRSRQERLQANVNADCRQHALGNLYGPQVAGKEYVPFAGFSLDGDFLHASLDRTMELDPNITNVLNSQSIFCQLDAALPLKLKRVEILAPFESWIPRFLATPNATKEALECQVESPHRQLGGLSVKALVERIRFFVLGKPAAAIQIAYVRAVRVPCKLPVSKAFIKEPPMRFQGDLKLARLVRVGIQPEFERSPHLLSRLLFEIGINGPSNKFCNGQACGLCELRQVFSLRFGQMEINSMHGLSIHTFAFQKKS